MKIVIKEKLKEFKMLMGMVKKIGSETKMVFNADEMFMMVSSANCAAGKLTFKKEFFDSYEIEGEQEEFGIFTNDMFTPLKFAKTELMIEHANDRIVMHTGKDKFKNPILTSVSGFDRLPELSFDFEATIKTSQLAAALTKLSTVGHDCIRAYVTDGKLMMKSVMGVKEVEVELVECGELEGKSLMSSIYLGYIADSSSTDITIKLKKDMPIMFEYDKGGAHMEYVIAPRVNED